MIPSGTSTVGIIGAGAAGLVTAQVLLQDGFDILVITRDSTPGGVWAEQRIYPGLRLNKRVVHGEFKFSSLPMPIPDDAKKLGGRMSGEDMRDYMAKFTKKFFAETHIRYQTEVTRIRRREDGIWDVTVRDLQNGQKEVLEFSRIVLCSGGCSVPQIPDSISQSAAQDAGFNGLVVHSMHFQENLDAILNRTSAQQPIVVIGGGKSAQDVAAYLANAGRKVNVVFEKADGILASSVPLPDFIRRSRFMSTLTPYIELRTRLERFLHTTWLGSKIVHFMWKNMSSTSFDAFKVPKLSPLRNTHSLFWGTRANDEGAYRPGIFHSLVNNGQIQLTAPARVTGYGTDGQSLLLNNGKSVEAHVVILATGYKSSWTGLFDEQTIEELGLNRRSPRGTVNDEWSHYTSLANPPPSQGNNEPWASSIYRGIVPAKNILKRDFAINGAVLSTNNGYTFEVFAHWISSYFLNDRMRLPSSVEEALDQTERVSAWLRKRYPDSLHWINESYSSNIISFSWPQFIDQLLDDMYLPSHRSGGNWLTWPFKVINMDEIANLGEERRQKRLA